MRWASLSRPFNSIAPPPFDRNGLDQAAEDSIVHSARELLRGEPWELALHLDEPTTDQERRDVADAVRIDFADRAEATRRDVRLRIPQARTSLAVGLLFLATCVFIARFAIRRTGPPGFVLARGPRMGFMASPCWELSARY